MSKLVTDPLTNKQYASVKQIIEAHSVSEYLVYSERRKGKTLKQALEYAINHSQPKKVIIDPNTGKRFKSYKEMLTAYGIDCGKGADMRYRKGISYEDQVRGLKPVTKITMEVIKPKEEEEETIQLTDTKSVLPEPNMLSNDAINPNHYKSGNMECIDALAETLGSEGIKAFCKGNVIKYLWRYEKKNGVEDLRKAQWYLNKLIEMNK